MFKHIYVVAIKKMKHISKEVQIMEVLVNETNL